MASAAMPTRDEQGFSIEASTTGEDLQADGKCRTEPGELTESPPVALVRASARFVNRELAEG